MKTSRIFTTTLLMILAFSFSAFATDEIKSEKLLMDQTVKTYINAIGHGQLRGLSKIMDNDLKLTLTRNNQIYNYSKTEVLSSLKPMENIEQNCSINYKIIEMDATQAIVKVDMNYELFTKVNYLSMINTPKGWKIVNISSFFN